MFVRMQNSGHSITGIRMRTSDAKRYFPMHVKSVDFELDHVKISCALNDSFWDHRSQISDPRLRSWLESKALWNNLSPLLEMQKNGNAYKLTFASKSAKASARQQVLLASHFSDED